MKILVDTRIYNLHICFKQKERPQDAVKAAETLGVARYAN